MRASNNVTSGSYYAGGVGVRLGSLVNHLAIGWVDTEEPGVERSPSFIGKLAHPGPSTHTLKVQYIARILQFNINTFTENK